VFDFVREEISMSETTRRLAVAHGLSSLMFGMFYTSNPAGDAIRVLRHRTQSLPDGYCYLRDARNIRGDVVRAMKALRNGEK
jgi:hypothetical protein